LSAGEAVVARPTRAVPLSNSIVIPTNGRDLQCSECRFHYQKKPRELGWRWVKFNIVGAVGVLVQLAGLWVLIHVFRCNYLVATALAVETAVVHNFLWHQRFTWADRVGQRGRETAVRFLQFNLANGSVSIVGNLLLMGVFVGGLHLRVLLANVLSILACSGVNFCLSEVYVFRARAISPRRHGGSQSLGRELWS
jgi:putative flippase GtrA